MCVQAFDGLSVTDQLPASFWDAVEPESPPRGDSAKASNAAAASSTNGKASHGVPSKPYFLLYLNQQTFLDDAGGRLADEVRQARGPAQLDIVMAHENDPQRAGCEFARCVSPSSPQPRRIPHRSSGARRASDRPSVALVSRRRFFTITPQDLINDGLYKALAISVYAGQKHRAVGMALLAKSGLGAVHRVKAARRKPAAKIPDATASASRAPHEHHHLSAMATMSATMAPTRTVQIEVKDVELQSRV